MAKKYNEQEHISELIQSADIMRVKLEETREKMKDADVIVPYNNGGGQSGTRENPIFPAYEKLMKCYQATLKQIRELTGAETVPHKGEVVQLVGNSRWKRA